MGKSKAPKRDLYYTNDYEWIDFQGSVAYIGVCELKLKDIKLVHRIVFAEDAGLKKQGETIASIQYGDHEISIHMPVDGKVISINDTLLSDEGQQLLSDSENNGWFALIVPSQPYERKGLMNPDQYKT